MIDVKSNGSIKEIVEADDLHAVSRNVVGDVLDIQAITSGNVCMLRASSYLKSSLNKGQTYRLNNISGIKPIYSVISYYPQSTGKPFILQITTEGDINIIPQVALQQGDSINFSETFIRNSIAGGGYKSSLLYEYLFSKQKGGIVCLM